MAAETVPTSTQTDGTRTIWYVPSGSNAKSAAILNGATAKKVTYSFTADGWNYTLTQAEVEDKRLTLDQDLTRPGRKKETLEVKYVRSTATDSADTLLTEGLEGQFAVRYGVSNATDATVTTQKVDIITWKAGAKRPDAPVENGVDTISQTLFITAVTQREQVIVA